MWFVLWVVVSVFILGVFAWSVQILFQQKAVWKSYAKKMNLTYQQPKGLLVSPIVTGAIGPYGFGLFSEPQITEDSRGQRFSTVLEFALRKGLPASGAIGTAKMMPFLNTLEVNKSLAIQDKDWDVTWGIRTDNPKNLERYLTQPRLDILKKIFGMKILAALFLFTEDDIILRIETSDPLNNLERLEKVVKGVIGQLSVLTPKEGENLATGTPVSTPPSTENA